MKQTIKIMALACLLTAASVVGAMAQTVEFLSKKHCLVRFDAAQRYLLLPVEEKAEVCNLRLLSHSNVVNTLNVRLAVDNVDYYVPLDLAPCGEAPALLDVHINASSRQTGNASDYVCWKNMRLSNDFDTANREAWRPDYHHTPAWGWMNDPNGLFYKDGVYHLFYQWNPYGSTWENMHWGHSTSSDLVHWKNEGLGIAPDALGTVFSGCCVVDKDNTAGFGAGAVVAMYTSAGESQTQSLAYSTDGGKTFTKYAGNPVITSDVPDFRDPHIFWNNAIGAWNLILAAGQEMRIYTSKDLKAWNYESSFGQGYGCHEGVWECPDLVKLPVEGTNEEKWVLICNINPGGPAGGSATQYFVGAFDGHTFKSETPARDTLWMDYGKDHYAAVTFDNAPDGRHILIGWMSNWQYANQVPTKQYRSANTIARDIYLFKEGGRTLCGSRPVPEMAKARGKMTVKTSFKAGKKVMARLTPSATGTYEIDMKLVPKKGEQLTFILANGKNEEVVIAYNQQRNSITVNRNRSGQTAFSEFFPVETVAPVHGGTLTELRLFVDKGSVELFANDGRTVMSNIMFPSEPYNRLTVSGVKGSKISSLCVYEINK